MQPVEEFLSHHRLAIVGVSRNSREFSRALFRAFRDRNFDVVPVNPNAGEIEGLRCYGRLQDIAPEVEGALLVTPPALTEHAVRECAAAGIRRVWMYRRCPPAVDFCNANGIAVIAGECPLMFFRDAGWIHRFHGWVRRITSNTSRTTPDSAPSGPSDN